MANEDILMDNAGSVAEARINAPASALLSEAKELAREQRIAWWREARFGMFIHWGLYSELGGEWKGREVKAAYAEHIQLHGNIPVREYEQIAGRFNPVKFDADAWVRAAKAAGMKYMVVTAKHHDGFAMYDSKASDFNIVKATPFGRDPMKELAAACAKAGIRLCFYYSHAMDWHHPDSQGNTLDYPYNIGAYDPLESWIGDDAKRTRYENYLREKAFPQLKELLTKYGPIGIIWFDCGHKISDEQGARFADFVHDLQPDCLVNRRVRREGFGDYGNSSDNQLHIRVPRSDWESCATLNHSWGYKKSDNNWKSVKDILHNLIDVASLNGNYLLNVGPTGDGEFDPKSLELLSEIGNWMDINGESIHGTLGSPLGKPPWGRCTISGQKLYLHVWDWPGDGILLVPGLRNHVTEAYLLADPRRERLSFRRLNDDDVLIEVPQEPLDTISCVVVVEFEGAIEANPLKRLFGGDVPIVFGAFEGEISGTALKYDTGKKGRDNVTGWTNAEDAIRWTFRAAEPGSYQMQAVYAVDDPDAGSTYEVSVGDASWTAVTIGTGGGYEFAAFDIGTVAIPAAGEYTLTVKPQAIAGTALMNLKEIRLEETS
jgi:alpha-L-fucosidase